MSPVVGRPHIAKVVLGVHLNFADVRPLAEESLNNIIAKINVFHYFSLECDLAILEVYSQFVIRRDDVFIALLSLSAATTQLTCANLTTSARILCIILAARDYSWVSRTSVVNLIGALSPFEVELGYREYVTDAVAFVVSSTLCPQMSFTAEACTVAVAFLDRQNVHEFRAELMKVGFSPNKPLGYSYCSSEHSSDLVCMHYDLWFHYSSR
jgi:hypothetical protein